MTSNDIDFKQTQTILTKTFEDILQSNVICIYFKHLLWILKKIYKKKEDTKW